MANNESNDLNTGMPGFVVDGRLHQMTPGDPNAQERADPISPLEKKGKLSDIDVSGDIPKTTRTTLADYLGKSTTRKNYYPLDGHSFNQGISAEKQFGEQTRAYTTLSLDNQLLFPTPPPTSREVSITSPGDTYVPSLEPTINTNHFANPEELSTSETSPGLQGWYPREESDSSIFDAPNLPFVKGRSKGWDETGTVTGNNLLRDTMDPSVPSLAATEKVLRVLSKNRFSPQGSLNPSIEYGIGIPIMHLQDASITVGANFRGGAWARGEGGIIEGSFYAESLSGSVMGYNSPLHNPRYPNLRTDDMALASNALLNGAKLNGKDEKKEYESFSEVFAALAYSDELEREVNYISINDGKAHKNSYTSENMFDGASDIVMTVLGQFGLKIIAQIISQVFEGESSIIENYFIGGVIDVGYLRESIGVGLEIFYNQRNVQLINAYDTKDPGRDAILVQAPSWKLPKSGRAYGNEGILAETSKSIIRAIYEYDNSLENIKGGNEAIKIFGKSKLARILVAFSKIGEAQIEKDKSEADLSARYSSSTGPLTDFFLDGNTVETSIGNVSKWASHTAKSLLLNSSNYGGLEDKINAPLYTKVEGLLKLNKHQYAGEPVNRIPKEKVDILERSLDSEYMPFYFHDLRTNEIINFHAFLSSLSDGFSASYDSIEGFGRVEPIKIYKGTQRKISMEFSIVSTSPEDFNIMWHKINKLVTLVYPQYTEGRRLEKNGYNFVQPFSQMMGASPLIRIRLGNVLRSNYSRFALARLFGAGLDNKISFKKDEATVVAAEVKATEVREARSKERILVEKKDEISKKINEASKNFDDKENLFLLKNPKAVNSQKGQNHNFKSLFKNYQDLAKNLCCQIISTRTLPQRTGEKTVTETNTVLDEQATVDRDQRVYQQNKTLQAREDLLKEKQTLANETSAASAELEKAKKRYDESITRPFLTPGNTESRRQEMRKKGIQQKNDENAIAAAEERLHSLKVQSEANNVAYNELAYYIASNDLDVSTEKNANDSFVGPLTRQESVSVKKTYRWTPLLVTLRMKLDLENLDAVEPDQREKFLFDLAGLKASNSSLGEEIIIETLSGNLKLSNKAIKKIEDSFLPQETTPAVAATESTPEPAEKSPDKIDPLIEFIKPENNALVKSFEEAGGKGLAGVIESLDFSWLDQAMWDIDGGIDGGEKDPKSKKAPMMCKVSISFAPIHDISPGLDSKGRNRAPVYPVGLAHIPDE